MPVADPIDALLAGQYVDPETGELLAAESRAIVIADSLAGGEADLVGSLGLGGAFAVVADVNTMAVLGDRVYRALAGRFRAQLIVVDMPHADSETVARVVATIEPGVEALVAVGSGTLNDLT